MLDALTAIALGAASLAGLLSELQLREMNSIRGLLLIGAGLKLLSIRDIEVADHLPAISSRHSRSRSSSK